MISLYKELGKFIILACLTKTCLFELFLKSDLPTELNLNGRSILTVQR